MPSKKHDLVIIGSGPAGLSAAIYAARYKIDFLLVGRLPGGNMAESYDVENYPGLEKTTHGADLAKRMADQLARFGHEAKIDDIQAIKKESGGFRLFGAANEYETKNILLTVGMERNKLNIPGEEEFTGRGVAYCATCDGFFYKGKTVAVVGGGDAAVTAALYLADITNKVYLVVRKNELRAEPTWQEKIKKDKKIEIIFEANVVEIKGTDKVESIVTDKEKREVKVDGVFIEIGQTPLGVLFDELGVKRDDKGFVIVDGTQRTNIPGVWAAGDISTNSGGLKQIVTAASEGAIASVNIFSELKKSK